MTAEFSAVRADTGVRIAAVLVDMLPTLLLVPVIWISVIGQLFGGLILLIYWLLRDVFGRSLGKKALGLDIRTMSGAAPGPGALVVRNLTISVSFFAYMLPFIGYPLFLTLESLMNIIELILVISTGARLGDRLAGTVVVRAI